MKGERLYIVSRQSNIIRDITNWCFILYIFANGFLKLFRHLYYIFATNSKFVTVIRLKKLFYCVLFWLYMFVCSPVWSTAIYYTLIRWHYSYIPEGWKTRWNILVKIQPRHSLNISSAVLVSEIYTTYRQNAF